MLGVRFYSIIRWPACDGSTTFTASAFDVCFYKTALSGPFSTSFWRGWLRSNCLTSFPRLLCSTLKFSTELWVNVKVLTELSCFNFRASPSLSLYSRHFSLSVFISFYDLVWNSSNICTYDSNSLTIPERCSTYLRFKSSFFSKSSIWFILVLFFAIFFLSALLFSASDWFSYCNCCMSESFCATESSIFEFCLS